MTTAAPKSVPSSYIVNGYGWAVHTPMKNLIGLPLVSLTGTHEVVGTSGASILEIYPLVGFKNL